MDKKLKNKFLSRLSESKFYKGEAGKLLLRNLKKQPDPFEESLLVKLAESNESSYHIVRNLDLEFEKILPQVVETILHLLCKTTDPDTISALCKFLNKNFHEIRFSLVIDIMKEIRLKEPAPAYLTGTILSNYDILPSDIQNYIFDFVQNDAYKNDVLIRIAQYFPNLPEKIQNLLREHSDEFYSFLKVLSQQRNEDKLSVLDILSNIPIPPCVLSNIVSPLLDDLDDEIRNKAKQLLKS